MPRKKSPKPVEAQAAEDMANASSLTDDQLQAIETQEMAQAVSDRALNVITVKVGELYPAEYISKMRSMLERHLKVPFQLYCVTDDPNLTDAIPIQVKELLPGWWSKMYVFSDLMPTGPLLYLDLDQIILDDITTIVQECQKYPFACYADHVEMEGVKLGTAWMQFESGSLTHIFEQFWDKRYGMMERYKSGGDQVYLGQFLQDAFYWNESFPDAVVSYKFDLKKGTPRMGNKLVNCHGKPKPHQITDDWIKEHWQ